MNLVMTAMLLMAAAGTACNAAPSALPRLRVPDCLGVNIHFTQRDDVQEDMLADAGFGFVRKDFVWGSVEAKKGEYNFTAYDRQVEALGARGIRILYILDYGNGHYDNGGAPCTDEGRVAFAAYAAAGAARFKGKGIIWELWNEPNNHFGSPPSAENYTRLAQTTYTAMKKADPNCVFAAPALAGWDFAFFENACKAGLLEYTDVVSLHPYGAPKPEDIFEYYAAIRSIIKEYAPKGRSYPLVSSEWGYPAFDKGVTIEQHAQYLARTFLVNMMNECRVNIWYCWRDMDRAAIPNLSEMEYHFGVLYSDLEKKPSYFAMKTLATELKGYSLSRRLWTESEDDYLLLFSKGSNYRLAAWTAGDHHTVSIPLDVPSVTSVSLLGEKKQIAARDGMLEIDLTGSVQYLKPSAPSRRWAVEAGWDVAGKVAVEGGSTAAKIRSGLSDVRSGGMLLVTGRGLNSAAVPLKPGRSQTIERYAWDGSASPRVEVRLTLDGMKHPVVRTIDLDTSALPSIEVLPSTGSDLLIAVNRPSAGSNGAIKGKLVLSEVKGIELSANSAPFEIAPGQEKAIIRVGLFGQPTSIFSFACALLDNRDHTILRTPAKRYLIVSTFADGKPGDEVPGYHAVCDASADPPGEAALSYARSPEGGVTDVCVKLDYSVHTGWKPVMMLPSAPLSIPGKPISLKAWIKGDGASGSAKLRIQDANGEVFQPNYRFTNFTDWRCIEVDLSGTRSNHWGGDNDGRIQYPISWNAVFVIESIGTNNPLKGSTHIGPLMLCYD